jgi:hypothetical protein
MEQASGRAHALNAERLIGARTRGLNRPYKALGAWRTKCEAGGDKPRRGIWHPPERSAPRPSRNFWTVLRARAREGRGR